MVDSLCIDSIVDEASSLSEKERLELIKRIEKTLRNEYKLSSAKERCSYLMGVAETVLNYKTQTHRRSSLDVLARQFVSYKMYEEKYTLSTIGSAIGKDHSTISNLCKRMKDMMSLPRIYQKELEQYKQFEALIK